MFECVFLRLMNRGQHRKTYTVEEAQARLERYCAYQDRCHKEVEKKLTEMRMIPAAKEQIILHLMQHDYLNESRFAQSFARGKFRTKKWGKQRITRELKARGISAYNLKLALKEISDTEYYSTFHTLAEKRFAAIPETNPQKKKKKLADYLLYRGWETHLIYEKINELMNS